MSRSATIDGNAFADLSGFYDEVERKLTRDLGWSLGRNLDAFNDILRGGFGVHEYNEELELVWLNSAVSERQLGNPETISYLEVKLRTCHPSNVPHVEQDLEEARSGRGDTLFKIIVEIIKGHDHVALVLQ